MAKDIPLIKHIEELRKRIIYSLLAIILTSAISYFYKETILLSFVRHIEKAVFLTPHEAFVSYLKLSLLCGILIASPFLIYEIWAFIWSAFKPIEKKHILTYGISSFFLFSLGCLFGYFLGLPLSIDFLLGFKSELLLPMISIGKYITFTWMLILVLGILFELPLIILFVTNLGLISTQQLSSKRRHIIVIIFIMAAILSPPDIFTQLLVALPLYILFELSILLAKLAERKK